MINILVYGDSLAWGIIPGTRERLEFKDRWPGFMQNAIQSNQKNIRVIENCLNGRRTACDDPFLEGRNGINGIQQIIEMHSPLDLIILALGTNDFQSMHDFNAWHSAQGLRSMIYKMISSPVEPSMKIPPILIVVPPMIDTPTGPIAPKFKGGASKMSGLSEEYKRVSEDLNCHYFDCGLVTKSSEVDGIHLDKYQHHIVGEALAEAVSKIID